MSLINGRPRKHNPEHERNIALGYVEAKRREPWLTQKVYAESYNISPRTLRRYIKEHGELALINIQMSELEKKKSQVLQEKECGTQEEKKESTIKIGFQFAWL